MDILSFWYNYDIILISYFTTHEKTTTPLSGYLMVAIVIFLLVICAWGLIATENLHFLWPLAISLILMPGFFFLNPNDSVVLVLLGEYKGTVKSNGFFWVNPLFTKKTVSLRARIFDSDKIKVNDKVGNPIQIGVILVWQVKTLSEPLFR